MGHYKSLTSKEVKREHEVLEAGVDFEKALEALIKKHKLSTLEVMKLLSEKLNWFVQLTDAIKFRKRVG